jgi:hypothetical protein
LVLQAFRVFKVFLVTPVPLENLQVSSAGMVTVHLMLWLELLLTTSMSI